MTREDIETFDGTDAGATATYPVEAGQIKKGHYIMIKNNPMKVIDVAVSKTGKHGHAKCHFTAVNIFSGKKMDEILSSTHGTTVPNVSRAEYTLINIDSDGALTLMTTGGELKTNLNLPTTGALAAEIRERFDEEQELLLCTLSACGVEQVMSFKVVAE